MEAAVRRTAAGFAALLAAATAAACSNGLGTGGVPGTGAAAPAGGVVHALALQTPIPLVKGGTIGTVVFPDGDTTTGGQGSPVDGIPCGDASILYHHHIHIALFVNGQQIALPRALGFVPPWKVEANGFADSPKCHYWIHTHDRTGVIHLEYAQAPNPPPTLGTVFDIWGEPLTSGDVAGYTGTVTTFVNGVPYQYAARNMGIGQDHIEVTLEVNSSVTPPVYNWATY